MVLGFSKLLGGFMAVLEKIASWVGALFSIIPKTLYLLITFAMQIVDIIQLLFQKLAGLDVYYVTENGTATKESGDFLIYFLRKVLFEKGTLNTVFWSIVILGLFLLVFATIVAVIRTNIIMMKNRFPQQKLLDRQSNLCFHLQLFQLLLSLVFILGIFFFKQSTQQQQSKQKLYLLIQVQE